MKIDEIVTVSTSTRMDRTDKANYDGHPGCHLCGKAIKTAHHHVIHVRYDEILPIEGAHPNATFFAVGSSCAKKIPATHKAKV